MCCEAVVGCCLQHCGEADSPCPVLRMEQFAFEMDKRYKETKLQLLLSPILLNVSDYIKVVVAHVTLEEAH